MAPAVMLAPPTIAVGASGGASSIASSVATACVTPATGELVGPYRYSGTVPVQVSASSTYIKSGQLTSIAGAQPYRIAFATDGDAFEIRVKSSVACAFRLRVDGELAYTTPTSVTGTDGGAYFILVTFASAASRQIMIETTGWMYFGGIQIGPTYTVSEPDPRASDLRVIVVGDSWTEGTGATVSFMGYTGALCDRSGYDDLWQSGAGGTGYLEPGVSPRVKFRDRIQATVLDHNPDIIIMVGGLNDGAFTPAAIGEEAALLFAMIRAALPDVRLIVVSALSPHTPSAFYLSLLEPLRTAASEYGGEFIDAMTVPWFAGSGNSGAPAGDGNADVFIGADNTHPTQAGHDYFGTRLAFAINPPATGLVF